jgi:hypothetical protein
LSVGIPSISWAAVKFKAVLVTQRITQQALQECPPAQRASVLRASAELASKLTADHSNMKPISLSLTGHRSPRQISNDRG